MGATPRYKRVLLKLSGESMCSAGGAGVDSGAIAKVVDEVLPAVDLGVRMAIVVGGGNIARGRDLRADANIERTTADFMGMLATVINALALGEILGARGADARVMSAIPMPAVCEPYTIRNALAHLDRRRIVICAGGTGNPLFTTDTCASLRAGELKASALLKATKVDGVFDSDPATNPDARRYERLTYQKVLDDRLGVMDLSAVTMCMENDIPIIVLAVSKPGNLLGAVRGDDVGTTVSHRA